MLDEELDEESEDFVAELEPDELEELEEPEESEEAAAGAVADVEERLSVL